LAGRVASVRRSRLLGLAVLTLSLAVLSGAARADKDKDEEKKKEQPAAPLPALPPDAILVIGKSTAEALEMIPGAFVLAPDKFRALQEELARLRQLADRSAAQTPTQLLLKGKVDGNLVLLTAQYEFKTDKAGAVVLLGGSPAQATGVSLDGKTPRLTA